jgi:hypothetical protein
MSEAENASSAPTTERREQERPANESPLPDPKVLELANEAVGILQLPTFFKDHPDYLQTIHDRLEEIHDDAEKVNARKEKSVKGEMTFMGRSLPLTNGVIHIGSDRTGLRAAVDWARTTWEDWPDPLSILTALTLVYIVERGWDENKHKADKRGTWARIGARVKMFSEDLLETTD